MTIDEMKNKISMELRSTDTQLGFEVICKKLTDLEEENGQLKSSYYWNRCKFCEYRHKENGNCLIVGGFYTSVDDRYCPKVKEKIDLQKENAELKAEKKQIIEREHVVPEHYLCEMIDKNKELKAQIKTVKKCLLENQDMFKDTIYLYRDRQNSFEHYDETLFEYLGLDLIVNGEKELSND